jgi:hypothetical protein
MGKQYTPMQVNAQLFHLSIEKNQNWLKKNKPELYFAAEGLLKSRPLITASYKVFNSDDYLQQSLESIYDYVDCIDFVEGAIKNRLCEGKTSSDNTVDIITNFPDPEKKIRLIQGVYQDKQEIQAKLLEVCRSKWMLFIDADEIVDGMVEVRNFAEKYSDGKKVYARPQKFINFIHDFEHIVYSNNPMSPWSAVGLPHPFLIHRDIPGLNFGRFHTIPTDGFEVPIHSDSAEYRGKRTVLDDVTVYHFGNVLGEKKLAAKLTFERERGLGWETKDEEKIPVKENFMFSGVLPSDMTIEAYDKNSLPEIMKSHPIFNEKPFIEHYVEDEITKFKFLRRR